MGRNNPLNYYIITIEGRDLEENAIFLPQKTPLTTQIHLKNERNACVIH